MTELDSALVLGRWGFSGLSEAREYVLSSGLFDPAWYLRAYPEICPPGVDPLRQYLMRGAAEGRKPQLLFDGAFYARRYMAADDATHPLVHYITEGSRKDALPHPLFDPVWYRRTYLGDRSFVIDPLKHYTLLGRSEGYQPNRFFDPAFYLANNPEINSSGMDPLWHYMAYGEREGRAPCDEFDPFSVASALAGFPRLDDQERDPTDLGGQLERLLEAEAAGWMCNFSQFRTGNEERLAFLARSAICSSRPTTVIVTHARGGGTQRHADQLVRQFMRHSNVVLIRGRRSSLELQFFGRDAIIGRITFNETDVETLILFLQNINSSHIVINHIVDVPTLRDIIIGLRIPFEIIIHDYTFLSPQPHLVDCTGRFVGEDLELFEDALFDAATGERRAVSLRDWQRERLWLLDGAAKITVFSNDVRRRYLRRYPNLNITVTPPEAEVSTHRTTSFCQPSTKSKILLLGELAPHKGFDVVCDVASAAYGKAAHIEFILLGSSTDDAKLRRAGVTVRGPYQEAALDALIAREQADMVWFPAQCPETYSFTLTAALRSGLRILVSDLGALPERVAGRPGCSAFPWNATPSAWLEALTNALQTPRWTI